MVIFLLTKSRKFFRIFSKFQKKTKCPASWCLNIGGRCKELGEYSAFIAKVRNYEKELGDKEAGMKAAIRYCLEHGILEAFLVQNSSEVFNMLITEWNTEEAKKVWYEEAHEEGLEKGLALGLKQLEQSKEETARKALAEGLSIEIIQRITGLDAQAINNLNAGK